MTLRAAVKEVIACISEHAEKTKIKMFYFKMLIPLLY